MPYERQRIYFILALSIIAAGSVVTKDVAPRTIVMGNPARYFKDVDEEQLLENQ